MMKVHELMTSNVDFIRTDDTLQRAAEKMKDDDVGDIPVVLDGDVVGMITDRDITVRGVAHGLDPKAAKVVDAMTERVVVCKEEDEVQTAAQLMAQHKIRRLVVENAEGKMTGVVSLGDIATSLEQNAACDALREISK
ncbi:MAG: CBS domain-containing protein [Desulfobacterales bacterium]|nr:CBS domain-containing protein [Desulfobacterales bacterium]